MQPLVKTFKAGTFLFRENDHSRELYIVQSGSVRITQKIGSREIELARCEKGAVLGEMALIDGRPRSASAVAEDECSVILIDAETFHSRVNAVPAWFMSIISMVCRKIRGANERLKKAQTCDQHGIHIILALAYLLDRDKKSCGQDSRTVLALRQTRTRLIQLLGVTYGRVGAVLNFLADCGQIRIKDNELSFCDAGLFQRYAAFLRLYIRNAYTKPPQLSGGAVSLCTAVFEQLWPARHQGESTFEVQGAQLQEIATSCGMAPKLIGLIGECKQAGIISSVHGDSSAAAQRTLAHSTYLFSMPHLQKFVLYHSFSTTVPAL